jgi:hypothetical protein
MPVAVRFFHNHGLPLQAGALALALMLAVLTVGDRPASAATDPEIEIKIAIVYNIARFVEWPSERRPAGENGSRFSLGVEGDEQVLAAFMALADRKVGAANIEIVPVYKNDDLRRCHLVYFQTAQSALMANVADATLTVSDKAGFCRAGGMVELVRERNKIRFLVNPAAARAGGLQLSSQLLKLATIVEDN